MTRVDATHAEYFTGLIKFNKYIDIGLVPPWHQTKAYVLSLIVPL